MNERIKELAREAGFQISNSFGVMADSKLIQTEIEKFADLIIRECVDVADEVSMDDTIGYALLEHFGVGE